MEKKLDRSVIKNFTKDVEKCLTELSEKYGMDIRVDHVTYSEYKCTLKVVANVKKEDGSIVVSENINHIANATLKDAGVPLVGNAIGSLWRVGALAYQVVDYSPKRPKYPFTLKRTDGSLVKSTVGNFRIAEQIFKPTLSEFVVWFTMDPEDDRISKNDEVTCDAVSDYMEATLDPIDGDCFFDIINKCGEVLEMKELTMLARKTYTMLYGNSSTALKDCILRLKSIYKNSKK